jgi:hypothetical protein
MRLTLARMTLQPTGTTEEQAALGAELRRLDSRLNTEDWLSIEAAIAIDMQQRGFWERPDRFRNSRGTRSWIG